MSRIAASRGVPRNEPKRRRCKRLTKNEASSYTSKRKLLQTLFSLLFMSAATDALLLPTSAAVVVAPHRLSNPHLEPYRVVPPQPVDRASSGREQPRSEKVVAGIQ